MSVTSIDTRSLQERNRQRREAFLAAYNELCRMYPAEGVPEELAKKILEHSGKRRDPVIANEVKQLKRKYKLHRNRDAWSDEIAASNFGYIRKGTLHKIAEDTKLPLEALTGAALLIVGEIWD